MYGTFDDTSADLLASNTLQLNTEYLYGLGEMPSSWSPAALQAQVIAARSYALVRYNKYPSLRSNCQCHIYANTNDQVFSGYSKESGSYGDKWVAAVNATGDGTNFKIAKYNGGVVDAYFSSSSGGATSPVSEVWGSTSYPYLIRADDTWALSPDVRNPYASWSVAISQGTLVSKLNSYLGLQGNITDINAISVKAKTASGAISTFEIVDSGGNIKTIYVRPSSQWSSSTLDISPDNIRSIIGSAETRPNTSFNGSNYISSISAGDATTAASSATSTAKLSSVSMSKLPGSATVESQLTFKGATKPLQAAIKVELQQKSGSKWKTLATSQTDSGGKWTFTWGSSTAGKKTLRVKATNSKNSKNTASKTITFSSAVSISGSTKAGINTPISLNGSTAPARAGLTVTIERKVGTAAWKKVGAVKTDEYGGWAFVSASTNKKVTTQFRAKLSDKTAGKATSKVIKVKVR
jgi:SpoIID/LytB domain protein